jgi:hypothetical protein
MEEPRGVHGNRKGVYKVLVAKHEGKEPFRKPRHGWDYNIKWIFKKWGSDMDRIDLTEARDRWRAVVNEAMNFRFPYTAGNFFTV